MRRSAPTKTGEAGEMARDEGETTSALTTEKPTALNILHSPHPDCSLIERSRCTRLNRSAPAVTLSKKHGRQREQYAQVPQVRFRGHHERRFADVQNW